MKPDIARLAGQIIKSYVDDNIPPTDTLVKVAKSEGLNKEWMGRIAETVNVKLYQDIHEKVGSSMIEFSLADPKIAYRRIKDEERTALRKSRNGLGDASKITALEKGAAIAAADEAIYYIQKGIEKNTGGMQKVASESKNGLRAEESQAIKKYVEMFKGAVIGATERMEREINRDIKEVGDVIMSDTRIGGNTAEVLSQVKTAAIEAFPENKEGMESVIDMVKESSSYLSTLRPYFGRLEKVSLDKNSHIYELLEGIVDKMQITSNLYKTASDLKEANIDFYPKTKEEARAIIEKVSGLSSFLGKQIVKSPIGVAFGGLMGYNSLGNIGNEMAEITNDEFVGADTGMAGA